MGDNAWCPGCDCQTSSIAEALRRGDSCPYCGLSADAIREVVAAQERHGETQLVERLAELLKRAEKAEDERALLRGVLGTIRKALREVGDGRGDPSAQR